jgi:hypothetical protein
VVALLGPEEAVGLVPVVVHDVLDVLQVHLSLDVRGVPDIRQEHQEADPREAPAVLIIDLLGSQLLEGKALGLLQALLDPVAEG